MKHTQMKNNHYFNRIALLILIPVLLAAGIAQAYFKEHETVLKVYGNPTAYVLKQNEKSLEIWAMNYIGMLYYGFSDRITAGTSVTLDILLIPNLNFKYALVPETDKRPAIAIDVLTINATLITQLKSILMSMYPDDINDLSASLGIFNVALCASKELSKDIHVHGNVMFSSGEFDYDMDLKQPNGKDPLARFNIEQFEGNYTGIGANLAADYHLNRKLRANAAIGYSTVSPAGIRGGVSMLWAVTNTFRLDVGLPFKISIYWRFK